MPRLVAVFLASLLAFALVVPHATPAAAEEHEGDGDRADCTGDFFIEDVEQRLGPKLSFGINPAGDAGIFGPELPRADEVTDKIDGALADLSDGTETFSVRLNRFFWADGEEAFERFLDLADRYTSQGYTVSLQVRYHPTEEKEGDIEAWTEHVREVIARFGPNPLVTDFQITNEVTIDFSPDSSDGAFEGAFDALIHGVIAAKDEAEKLGHDHVEIGFNWFYRLDPQAEEEFWTYLRDEGGEEFVAALDWIGLDAYPGTYFPPSPPADVPGGVYDAMVNALSTLRCFAEYAEIPFAVPIRVVENGWPTGVGRPAEAQELALEALVRAVHDHCGTYNVDHYHWFNLQDENSNSPNFQQQYGIMRDDYTPKPAFERYKDLIAELSESEICVGDSQSDDEPDEETAAPAVESDDEVAPSRRLPATGGGLVALALALAGAALLLADRRRDR